MNSAAAKKTARTPSPPPARSRPVRIPADMKSKAAEAVAAYKLTLPAYRSVAPRADTIVERVLTEFYESSPTKMLAHIKAEFDLEISKQAVNGWRSRGVFPRNLIPVIAALTGLPESALITTRSSNIA